MKKVPGRKLAEGEATGHAHVLRHTDVFQESPEIRTFMVITPDAVTHEEHNPISLGEGEYDCGQVMEYDHFEEEAQRVMD